jgi:hypothetical protein
MPLPTRRIQPFSVGKLRLIDIRDVSQSATRDLEKLTEQAAVTIVQSSGGSAADGALCRPPEEEYHQEIKLAYRAHLQGNPYLSLRDFIDTVYTLPEPQDCDEDRELPVFRFAARERFATQRWLGSVVFYNVRELSPRVYTCRYAPMLSNHTDANYSGVRAIGHILRYVMTKPLIDEQGDEHTIQRVICGTDVPAWRWYIANAPGVQFAMSELEPHADITTRMLEGRRVVTRFDRKP